MTLEFDYNDILEAVKAVAAEHTTGFTPTKVEFKPARSIKNIKVTVTGSTGNEQQRASEKPQKVAATA